MTGTKRIFAHIAALLLAFAAVGSLDSCIQPPLKLPAQEVIVDMPVVITDLEIVWEIDPEWKKDWYYGWDKTDEEIFGPLEYPDPFSYEVRRYFLGPEPGVKHSTKDSRTINTTSFRDHYQFGYYDMLFWSNVYSPEEAQVLTIDESDLDEVTASTTITRSISLKGQDNPANALYNQPEIFYSAYPRDIYISHYKEDYDYYDEKEGVWVKKIQATLTPLVYIYLVQVIMLNNDGRVKDVSGDCAISAFASGTSVNSGHTFNDPCMVYFNARMKKDLDYKGANVDIIGAKLTTFGLCDMDRFQEGSGAGYKGTRAELPNFLFYELRMASGAVVPMSADVTDQCLAQSHGGVITVIIDCNDIVDPGGEGGNIFNPTVDDYEELEFEIPLG